MQHHLGSVLCVAFMCASLSTPLLAQQEDSTNRIEGWYVEGQIGASEVDDADSQFSGPGVSQPGQNGGDVACDGFLCIPGVVDVLDDGDILNTDSVGNVITELQELLDNLPANLQGGDLETLLEQLIDDLANNEDAVLEGQIPEDLNTTLQGLVDILQGEGADDLSQGTQDLLDTLLGGGGTVETLVGEVEALLMDPSPELQGVVDGVTGTVQNLLNALAGGGGGGGASGGGAAGAGEGVARFDSEFDTGIVTSLILGYQFASPWRAEAELKHIDNDFDQLDFPGFGPVSVDGDMTVRALMGNIWYDFNPNGVWHATIGAGIGAAQPEVDDLLGFSDDDTVMAGQVGVGISRDLGERFNLSLNYRYFVTEDPEFKDQGIRLDTEYQAHLLTLGLRYRFTGEKPAPQPPPPPPPEPEPVEEMPPEDLVLEGVEFDFDKATLRPESKRILDNAIRMLQDHPDLILVLVAGHTDAIGTEQYNQGLSERRAEAVFDYLTDGGIDPSRLETKGFGESQPIAPNKKPDGSDNPEGRQENRRVELEILEREGG